MKETIYYNDKDVLAKMEPIPCLYKNGKEMLVAPIRLDQSYK